MEFFCVTRKLLHFMHGKCTGCANFRVAGVIEFVLPFPNKHIDLIPGKISYETFNILTGILMMFCIIMNGANLCIRPVNYFHAVDISLFFIFPEKLKKSLHAIEKPI